MIELMFYQVANNLDAIIAISMLVAAGFFLRFLLQAFGQTWIRTKAHTATLLILPIVTYVITNVIAGNISLSLGMVGALSIVRFRNPVRSPLELSTYFGAITMGIAASVSIKWLVFLIASVTFAVVVMIIADVLSTKLLKRPMFMASFSEGNTLSALTIHAAAPIAGCERNDMLQSKIMTPEMITYSFASADFSKLQALEASEWIQAAARGSELRR